nr:hypothetical protein [Tanacetum cinerariifolium]
MTPDEDVPAEEFKIYSNPLFDEDEINFDKLYPHCFNVKSDFVESLLNQIPKSDFNFKEEIRLIENLMYDNSSPRPPKELNAKIADIIVESIPSLPIPEVKNIVEQPVERGNRIEKSLQNFRVIRKSSISFNNTSQISSIHAIASILSTKEPEHPLSMGYEHLIITTETNSDEVTESNAKNLLPIPSECEVTSEDEIECDMPAKDDCSPVFTTFSNPLFNNNDDLVLNVNLSSSTSNNEFLNPKKKIEIKSWLEDNRIIDSLVSLDEIEYFYTFPTSEELEYHEWLLKYPKPSWDTTSIIDHHLEEVVFGKPFARKTGLVYDQEEGTITFEKDNKKITFKMPYKMEAFNHIDFKDVNMDFIPPFVLENNDDHGKTYYSDSLTLGPEYREDESISKEIRHLMKLEREAKRHKGEVKKFLNKNEEEIFTDAGEGVRIYPDGELIGIPCKHDVAAYWNMALNDRVTPPPKVWVNPFCWLTTWRETYSHKVEPINWTNYYERSTCPTILLPPKKKKKRSKHEDEPFVKDGGNNAEASGSASRKAQQVEPTVGRDSLGGSGLGAVIGLSVADCTGGASGKDYAQNVKNQSKTRQNQHKIGSQHQKPDQQAFFSRNQAMKPKKSKESKFRVYSCQLSKVKSREKDKSKFQGLKLPI